LVGMRERARKIRSQMEVLGRVGAGREIELVIPAGVAYRTDASSSSPRRWWQVFKRGWS
jgi:hypothetical protein